VRTPQSDAGRLLGKIPIWDAFFDMLGEERSKAIVVVASDMWPAFRNGTHRRERLAWFAARGLFAHGATEGFNNKARITTRKACGFRSYEHAEVALYHALGDLPEPHWLAHRFC
jgi:hypothetical protein